MSKLSKATDWKNRHIDDWNTTTFHEYLRDKHVETFGIDYVPFRSWTAEKGMIGNIIGTKTKPRRASNEELKRFIDVTFDNYEPSRQYPGTSFGFMWSYRKYDWQRVQAEYLAEQRRGEQAEDDESKSDDVDDLLDWI